jgi:hypothetical protein
VPPWREKFAVSRGRRGGDERHVAGRSGHCAPAFRFRLTRTSIAAGRGWLRAAAHFLLAQERDKWVEWAYL